MSQLFFIDPISTEEISWDTFFSDLIQITEFTSVFEVNDYYSFLKGLTISLIADVPIIVIDGNYTKTEKKLVYDQLHNKNETHCFRVPFTSKCQLHSNLYKPKKNWRISLFSSGTSGKSRLVEHNWDTITRYLKISEKHRSNIWGLAYNPAHIAGIQVILQAILNQNTIVRLFGLSPELIKMSLFKYSITHISATSSFYRQLLPMDRLITSVRRVTFGGEKINLGIKQEFQQWLPNAKFLNLYASTEVGTVLSAEDEVFTITNDMVDFVKIEDSILYLHHSLLPYSNDKVCEWYNTEDVVEKVNEVPLKFKFVKRAAHFVNVGGYVVNLDEVKDALLSLKNITNVRLLTKENKLVGNILLCDIETQDEGWTEQNIRYELSQILSQHKIPRVFTFHKVLPLGRTGKGE